MDWMSQDWEHEELRYEIYAVERQHNLLLELNEWEKNKKVKPAIIKISIKNETIHKSTSV